MRTDSDEERRWLIDTLTRQIPLGGAMALALERLDEGGITLSLPLAPNINDKGTVFGGAMSSAMILAGWSLPRLLLRRTGQQADLVIGRCEIRFLKPIDGSFRAECDWPETSAQERFLNDLEARGKASLELEPRIMAGAEVAATLSARYAALTKA